MRRSALALLGLIALPIAAAAQTSERLTTDDRAARVSPSPRFAVTPFVGVRVPFTTGEYVVTLDDGRQFAFREERAGGAMVGAQVEARLHGPFHFVGAAAYAASGETTYGLRASSDGSTEGGFSADGPTMYLARAGVGYRLPEPTSDTRRYHPSAMISAAPTIVWMDFADVDGIPEAGRSTRHFGLNLAADATSRLGSGPLSVNLGLDGTIAFWDFDELRGRDELLFSDVFDEAAFVDYDYSNSVILMARLGLSYRF